MSSLDFGAASSTTTLALRLRFARRTRNLGSRELSALVDAVPALVSKIEVGRTRMIQADTALRLARVLGVRVEWLVLGEGEGPPVPPMWAVP